MGTTSLWSCKFIRNYCDDAISESPDPPKRAKRAKIDPDDNN
jgi:hypothetical protein